MKGSTFKRCGCKDPGTGKEIGRTCPDLPKRRHGTWGFSIRLDTSTSRRELRRLGYSTQGAANNALDHVRDLVKLAGDDERLARKIGDMIFGKSRRGGQLPTTDDVRRRLGLGQAPGTAGETFAEAWATWLAGKKRAKRPSYTNGLEQIGRNWLLPVLADVPLDRLRGEHCNAVFERLDAFNEEVEAALEEGRTPNLPGDVRERVQRPTGVATQHRILAALRACLNQCWKKRYVIPFNPAYAVELEPEQRDAPLVWDPEQVAHFLACHGEDRLIAMWRLLLLRGLRRGELAGIPWDDVDLDDATVKVNVTLIQVGGRVVWGRPKSRAGGRTVDLDDGTVTLLRAHRLKAKRERLAAGPAWRESGRAFTREDGSALSPDWISRRFKTMAREAGLPVLRLHGGRHTAATLMLEAGIDVKIAQEVLGHSTSTITRDTYQHVRRQVHRDAAATVARLLPEEDAGEARS